MSPQYDPSINNKQFKWNCWVTSCAANIKFNSWVIKIYWAYSWATWACPECDGFDEETWNWIKHKFLSDYDTQYTRSIMSGDYLPFGWILPKYNTKYISSADCNASNVWKWNKNTVKVKFETFKWNWSWSPVYTRSNLNWFGWSLLAFPDNSVLWESYIPANKTHLFAMWLNTIKGYITNRELCESYLKHKIVGYDWSWNAIWWNVTRYKWTWNVISSLPLLFASQTFTVTDSYMLQLGTAFSNVSNVDLHFNWELLNHYGVSTVNTVSNYNTWALSKVLWEFINKYKQYAVLPDQHLFRDTTVNYKKLLTQEVYYIWNKNIVIHWDVTQPTTILVESGNVTINGNIIWPLMLVVKNGKIIFENANMNKQTVLDWYYITDEWFEVAWPASTSDKILNTNPHSSRWYADGRLKIKWVLVWKNADKIYEKRRSVLKNYFRNWFGPARAIKNWASLTVTSNPNLWLNAPIWSKDLFGMLRVSKWY